MQPECKTGQRNVLCELSLYLMQVAWLWGPCPVLGHDVRRIQLLQDGAGHRRVLELRRANFDLEGQSQGGGRSRRRIRRAGLDYAG